MSVRRRHLAPLLVPLLAGCYASNSPPEPPIERELKLADLSDEQYASMCEWAAEAEGWPDREPEDCSVDGMPHHVRSPTSPERCMMVRLNREDDPDCEATVSDWYDCQFALGEDICQIGLPECGWEGCRRIVP